MKKKLFLSLIVLCISFASFGQVYFPKNAQTGEVEFVRVVELDSIPKKDIFFKSKLWLVDVFKSANDVIQYENLEDGKIVGKGNLEIQSTGLGLNGTIHPNSAGNVSFTLEISVKEGKARIRIYDLVHKAKYGGGQISNVKPDCGTFNFPVRSWQSVQQNAVDNCNLMLASFEKTVRQSAKTKDEW